MKKLKKIEVIQEAQQLISDDLSFDKLQRNELKAVLGGECGFSCSNFCVGQCANCNFKLW